MEVDVQKSQGRRILVHSADPEILDQIRSAIGGSCDVSLAITIAATFEELRARHFDALVTDEPALILVLHDRFPTVEARSRFASKYFKTEYAYDELLKEYRERHREFSSTGFEEISTLLIRRYSDAMRAQIYPAAASLATRTVPGVSDVRGGLRGVI